MGKLLSMNVGMKMEKRETVEIIRQRNGKIKENDISTVAKPKVP